MDEESGSCWYILYILMELISLSTEQKIEISILASIRYLKKFLIKYIKKVLLFSDS